MGEQEKVLLNRNFQRLIGHISKSYSGKPGKLKMMKNLLASKLWLVTMATNKSRRCVVIHGSFI